MQKMLHQKQLKTTKMNLKESYDLKDKQHRMFNLDETGLQPEHRPPNVIASSDSKPQSTTSPKETTVT